MFIKDWKKDVFTIPNILSMFRLVLIPVYVVIYLNAKDLSDYFLAGTILAVSCLTDMIDGKIARHFNMISTLGKILDPIADKATQFTLTLCLSIKYPILRFVLVLFIVKELFQGIAGLVNLRRGKMLPGALLAGKVCTTVLFISLILLVLMPDLNETIIDAIAITDLAFLSWSFISYILAYFGKKKKVQDLEN
ncbi:MAG: CDP-alcohol phosphatidyltransferase family protein [Oscillospiraceae bacterium]|nr:CDP-alcohol phosphatidyltransferase family protein [Oscillospiraceae bacterium]